MRWEWVLVEDLKRRDGVERRGRRVVGPGRGVCWIGASAGLLLREVEERL